jgi:hypothetical protein
MAASPAAANTSEGFVAGAGVVTDDFGDEGVIDYNSNNKTVAAGMWQAILWADGAIETDGTAFDLADIDCNFGSNTTAATRSWQSTHGLSADGSAGPITLSKADNNLVLGSRVNADDDNDYYVYYYGSKHKLTFDRFVNVPGYVHAYLSVGAVIGYWSIPTCNSATFVTP